MLVTNIGLDPETGKGRGRDHVIETEDAHGNEITEGAGRDHMTGKDHDPGIDITEIEEDQEVEKEKEGGR